MHVPSVLMNAAAQTIGADRTRAWANALDHMFYELQDRWHFTPDPKPGSPWAGAESIVIPVLSQDGYKAIVRFAAPNLANPGVHAQVLRALELWNGHGAVRVIHQDAAFRATMQERLRTRVNLSAEPLDRVAPIWGQLARALKVPGEEGFVRVQDIAAGWSEKFNADMLLLAGFPEIVGSDHALLGGAREWTDALARNQERWLLHADLHYYNILAGNPDTHGVATWKAIDPLPLTGPTAYMVAPVLWNRLFELPGQGPSGQAAWLRAFAVDLCHQADIDPQFGLGAAIAREAQNMFWYLRSAFGGTTKSFGDAGRSLWVMRALAGHDVRGIDAHALKRLG